MHTMRCDASANVRGMAAARAAPLAVPPAAQVQSISAMCLPPQVKPGTTVAVFGLGAVGLAVIEAAKKVRGGVSRVWCVRVCVCWGDLWPCAASNIVHASQIARLSLLAP